MCGIFAVIYGTNLNLTNIRSYALKLRHRGPDGYKETIGQNQEFFISHCRHTVVDLTEHGIQPFVLHESGQRLIWIMNSEIYN